MLVHRVPQSCRILKINFRPIQDGGRPQIFNLSIAITPPRFVRFRSNTVQSLITRRPIHYNRSRSKGQTDGQTDRRIAASLNAPCTFSAITKCHDNCDNHTVQIEMSVECVQAHKISDRVHDINLLSLHGEAIGKVSCKLCCCYNLL